MSLRILSLIATVVLAAAVIVLLVQHELFARNPVAIALQILAVLLMVWARVTFGARSFHAGANPTEGGLVTTGPYHFVRHPIYAALLLLVWAGVASHADVVGVLLALVATGAIAVRIAAEERLVTATYPEYGDYAKRTKRIIPYVF